MSAAHLETHLSASALNDMQPCRFRQWDALGQTALSYRTTWRKNWEQSQHPGLLLILLLDGRALFHPPAESGGEYLPPLQEICHRQQSPIRGPWVSRALQGPS